MEFLEYLIASFVVFLILFKPQKEKLAFGLLWLCIVLDVALWIIASAASWIPGMTL